jgi:hypothetical protein
MDHALTSESDAGRLYETDFAAWALDQAARLRSAADAGAERAGLDWINLAEEIEALARRDRRELADHLHTIAEHLMKLQASPAVAPRSGWQQTVIKARAQVRRILKDSPSLRRTLPDVAADEVAEARADVLQALRAFAEVPRVGLDRLYYTPEQLVEAWWPDDEAAS